VPDKPSGVKLLENVSTPNTLRLHVLPPGEFNGLDLLGYRVKYDELVYDFDAGGLPTLQICAAVLIIFFTY